MVESFPCSAAPRYKSKGRADDPDCVGLARLSHRIIARPRDFARRFVEHTPPWRRETREAVAFFRLRVQRRIGLGGPGDDAAFVARCDDAYQTGEARGFAAAARRTAASPQVVAAGHPDVIATLMRRTLMRTRAPILSSLRRMVPQVALAYSVSWRPIRRKAQSSN